jgi:hypothetical protein
VEFLIGIPIWTPPDTDNEIPPSNDSIPNLLVPLESCAKEWKEIFKESHSKALWGALPLFCSYIWRITDQMNIYEQNQLLLSYIKSQINGEFEKNYTLLDSEVFFK